MFQNNSYTDGNQAPFKSRLECASTYSQPTHCRYQRNDPAKHSAIFDETSIMDLRELKWTYLLKRKKVKTNLHLKKRRVGGVADVLLQQ